MYVFFFSWEVLHGVGVDGVGVIFPFFYAFFVFYAFFRFFPLFFVFLRFSLLLPKDKGKQHKIYCKNGEFHSDPVYTDPVQNFPILCFVQEMSGCEVTKRFHGTSRPMD